MESMADHNSTRNNQCLICLSDFSDDPRSEKYKYLFVNKHGHSCAKEVCADCIFDTFKSSPVHNRQPTCPFCRDEIWFAWPAGPGQVFQFRATGPFKGTREFRADWDGFRGYKKDLAEGFQLSDGRFCKITILEEQPVCTGWKHPVIFPSISDIDVEDENDDLMIVLEIPLASRQIALQYDYFESNIENTSRDKDLVRNTANKASENLSGNSVDNEQTGTITYIQLEDDTETQPGTSNNAVPDANCQQFPTDHEHHQDAFEIQNGFFQHENIVPVSNVSSEEQLEANNEPDDGRRTQSARKETPGAQLDTRDEQLEGINGQQIITEETEQLVPVGTVQTGEAFQTTVQSVNRTVTHPSTLTRRKRKRQSSHSNRPCPICGALLSRTGLIRHMASHAGYKPENRCTICSSGFIQRFSLLRHMRLSHGSQQNNILASPQH